MRYFSGVGYALCLVFLGWIPLATWASERLVQPYDASRFTYPDLSEQKPSLLPASPQAPVFSALESLSTVPPIESIRRQDFTYPELEAQMPSLLPEREASVANNIPLPHVDDAFEFDHSAASVTEPSDPVDGN